MCRELDLLKLSMSFKSNWNKTCWLPLVSSLNLWYLQGFVCPCLQSPHTFDQQESSQSSCLLQFIQQSHQASKRYEHLGALLSSVTSSIDATRGILRNWYYHTQSTKGYNFLLKTREAPSRSLLILWSLPAECWPDQSMSPRTLIVDHSHREKNSCIFQIAPLSQRKNSCSVSLGILLRKHYYASFEGRKTCHLLKTFSRCEHVIY